ncbi:MAG TPA: glycosyltransferase [Stellaceae bacterium]|nr:glycosyltransferase [Stellaceae bacterium]
MKTIGLCMIVKNEARIILRCLASVRPLVDYVLIEDTGSTDATQAMIRDYLARENLPGQVFDEPWRDFAANRTIALERLRGVPDVDYALIIDADDVLVLERGFDAAAFKAALMHDLYYVDIRHGAITHRRAQLFSNRVAFRYRGVLHEFPEGPSGADVSMGDVSGFHIVAGVEGARSDDPDKYRKDADLLARALADETDPFLRARYTFYLAQSRRDAGAAEAALATYLERAELGFWEEEVFISLYTAGQLMERLGYPDTTIVGTFLKAWEACPRRAESLHGAARYCRVSAKYRQGYMFAKHALTIPPPPSGLFLTPWIYDYGLLDELAVNAYWAVQYRDSLAACERLLDENKFPAAMRERIEMNARFARDKLAGNAG